MRYYELVITDTDGNERAVDVKFPLQGRVQLGIPRDKAYATGPTLEVDPDSVSKIEFTRIKNDNEITA